MEQNQHHDKVSGTGKRGNPSISYEGLAATLAALCQMLAHAADPVNAPEPDLSLLLVDAVKGNFKEARIGGDGFGPYVEFVLRKPGPGVTETSAFRVDPAAFVALRLMLAAGESIYLNPSNAKNAAPEDHKFYVRLLAGVNFNLNRLVANPAPDQEVNEADDWHDARRGHLRFKGKLSKKAMRTREDAITLVREGAAKRQATGKHLPLLSPEAVERAIRSALSLVDRVELASYRHRGDEAP